MGGFLPQLKKARLNLDISHLKHETWNVISKKLMFLLVFPRHGSGFHIAEPMGGAP